jgi:GNAT superfamily N-acetyltransferase
MTKPIIKATSTDDIAALQAVLDATELFPSEMLPDMLAPSLAGETKGFWLTCHSNDEPVGLCFTVPEEMADGAWNMLALAVRPDMQGKGFGASLVRTAEQRLKDQGQRILIGDTSGAEGFALTRRFYAKIGYEEEARIRDFWADGDDKVIFRKAL